MIRIYTIWRVLSMGDTMGCGVVSIRVNRHFSRHGKLGPQEGRGLGLVYTSQKAPADNGTLRRGTTSDERKGRPCWLGGGLGWLGAHFPGFKFIELFFCSYEHASPILLV